MRFTKRDWLIVLAIIAGTTLFKVDLGSLLLGIMFCLIGLAQIGDMRDTKKRGISCRAQIIGDNYDDNGYRTPIIEFTAANGQHIRKEAIHYAEPGTRQIGSTAAVVSEPVEIVYDADNPGKFVLPSKIRGAYISPAFLIVFGIMISVLSIANLLGIIRIYPMSPGGMD